MQAAIIVSCVASSRATTANWPSIMPSIMAGLPTRILAGTRSSVADSPGTCPQRAATKPSNTSATSPSAGPAVSWCLAQWLLFARMDSTGLGRGIWSDGELSSLQLHFLVGNGGFGIGRTGETTCGMGMECLDWQRRMRCDREWRGCVCRPTRPSSVEGGGWSVLGDWRGSKKQEAQWLEEWAGHWF